MTDTFMLAFIFIYCFTKSIIATVDFLVWGKDENKSKLQ